MVVVAEKTAGAAVAAVQPAVGMVSGSTGSSKSCGINDSSGSRKSSRDKSGGSKSGSRKSGVGKSSSAKLVARKLAQWQWRRQQWQWLAIALQPVGPRHFLINKIRIERLVILARF